MGIETGGTRNEKGMARNGIGLGWAAEVARYRARHGTARQGLLLVLSAPTDEDSLFGV